MADALVRPDFKARGLLDTAVVTLRYDSGAMATADASFQAVYGYDVRAEVFGSEGMASVGEASPINLVHHSRSGRRTRDCTGSSTCSARRTPPSSRTSPPACAARRRPKAPAKTVAQRSSSPWPRSAPSRPAARSAWTRSSRNAPVASAAFVVAEALTSRSHHIVRDGSVT